MTAHYIPYWKPFYSYIPRLRVMLDADQSLAVAV